MYTDTTDYYNTMCFKCNKPMTSELVYSVALESKATNSFCYLNGKKCVVAYCCDCWREIAGPDHMFDPSATSLI